MCRNHAGNGRSNGFDRGALIAFIVCVACAGCGKNCVTFVSNPSGGATLVSTPSCTLTEANATIDLRISSVAAPRMGSRPTGAQHIFLSLRSIQAHSDETADEGSAGWVDFVPALANQPLQVDLMAPAADSCSPSSLSENVVVAGVYRQIRLRLVSNQPAAAGPVPQENACGTIGFNCIVTADGVTRTLIFDGEVPEIHIRSDRISGGLFRILPDVHTSLVLQFDPYSSTALPAAEAVRLHPVFTLDVEPPCDSGAS